jgi:uncharacterized protein (TIGR01777 family)
MDIKNRIVIAGGSGFLGRNLTKLLVSNGYKVTILSRRKTDQPNSKGTCKTIQWDGRNLGGWAKELEGSLALINLAGRSVDCIKTPSNCDEILRSRVESTQTLGNALKTLNNPPSVWVQMSTTHIYGDPPSETCDENSIFGYGLAPTVAKAWEEAHIDYIPKGIRSVILRTSFVISKNGGALPRLERLTRLGLGGKISHGNQGISWIHYSDMNKIFIKAIESQEMFGAYIASSPHPVSNKKFMRELRKVLNVPIGLPATEWMVKIGAPLLMKTDPELALYGRYCIPSRLSNEGFTFNFPLLNQALNNIYTSHL